MSRKPDSIWDIIQARGSELGPKVFLDFIDDGETITYREAALRAEHLGKGLLASGVPSGAKVGLLLRGSALHVYAWFATLASTLVDVPINPDFRGALLDHAIRKIDVTAMFTDADGLEALRTASSGTLAQLELVVVPDDVYHSAMAKTSTRPEIGKLLPLSSLEQVGRESTGDLLRVDPRALASIRFSSGTTGMPKGVMMDHGHMLASARKFNEMMDFGERDVMYTCFPFHHVFASITGVLSTMCAGASMIVARKFSASRYWQDIRKHDVTRAHVLDPLVPLLMKQPASDDDRNHKVPVMYTGAGHYPEFEARFGVRILPLYDMSELTVVLHYPAGVPRRPGSCGTESGLFDVKIVDKDNREMPEGADGEIVVRPRFPSTMFLGYYNDADQTVEKWRDLWFHTGDRGRKDADGFFYFLGRMGDRIRRRGVNISAEQIEAVVLQNAAVLECAAIAVPAADGEDEIKVCARLVPGASLGSRDLADYLRVELPKSMTVRYVEIYADLPKTQTEKVQRAALRQHGDHGLTSSTWDDEEGRFMVDRSTEE